jgi:hypothetical protein
MYTHYKVTRKLRGRRPLSLFPYSTIDILNEFHDRLYANYPKRDRPTSTVYTAANELLSVEVIQRRSLNEVLRYIIKYEHFYWTHFSDVENNMAMLQFKEAAKLASRIWTVALLQTQNKW